MKAKMFYLTIAMALVLAWLASPLLLSGAGSAVAITSDPPAIYESVDNQVGQGDDPLGAGSRVFSDDEIGIAWVEETSGYSNSSNYLVIDSSDGDFTELLNVDKDDEVTSIAFGDVDGDGRDEIGITLKSLSLEYYIFDDEESGFQELHKGGAWSQGWLTSIAFGDVDGDGKDEIGFTRWANAGTRYQIIDDYDNGFITLLSGGSDWSGRDNLRKYESGLSIAFGDIDGDGKDEVGIARRRKGSNPAYYILDDASQGFEEILRGGEDWDGDHMVTSIAFGDVDGDGYDEIGIASPYGDSNVLLDDRENNFDVLIGQEYRCRSIAFGDVDGDGYDEIGLAGG